MSASPTERTPTSAGERHGLLVAIERGPDGIYPSTGKPYPQWWWRCDCGAKVLVRPATVRSDVKRSGFRSCPACYRYHAAIGALPPRPDGKARQ